MVSLEGQAFARRTVLPLSTVGWLLMLFSFAILHGRGTGGGERGGRGVVGENVSDVWGGAVPVPSAAVNQHGFTGENDTSSDVAVVGLAVPSSSVDSPPPTLRVGHLLLLGGAGIAGEETDDAALIDLSCVLDVTHPHWPLFVWPSLAFATAWLLWHRYEERGWRRNVDVAVTSAAVSLQTWNMFTACPCEDHKRAYALAAGTAIALYAGGWAVYAPERFRTGIVIHALTHVASYICNILLFRCMAQKA